MDVEKEAKRHLGDGLRKIRGESAEDKPEGIRTRIMNKCEPVIRWAVWIGIILLILFGLVMTWAKR